MSKSNTAENDIILLIFNKTLAAHLGTLSGTGNANLYVSLHTADPGEAGDQSTSEATYTSYARVAVARTSGGWTVTGNQAANTALVQFPQCTGGSNTLTHVGVGTSASGAGQLLYSGALNANLAVSNLIQPQFSAGTLVLQED
jgi:hypothetical protein